MWMDTFQEEVLALTSEAEISRFKAFLATQKLSFEEDIEYAVALTESGKIAASGTFAGRILKCIAVGDDYRNFGLSSRIMTNLVNEEYRRGRTHLFIYTKPQNKAVFSDMGFYPVEEVPSKVVLMENRRDGMKRFLETISEETGKIVPSGAVVVNCNPFTLGHQYLLEYAASRCEKLHVFVVMEDRSSFPSEIRYRLVNEGVRHLSNVIVHKGKDYIISDATFPSYFIKEYDEVVQTQAKLDLAIFSRKIAPALNIQIRFVGEEPYCGVTAAYNQIMKETLPEAGVQVEEIPRKNLEGRAISASRVRELIRTGDIAAVKDLVPETTYRFLLSDEAQDIIKQIRSGFQRH